MFDKILDLINSHIVYANPSRLKRDWALCKKMVEKALAKADYEKAFSILEAMGDFGYKFNFLNSFKDSEVDHLIGQLTLQLHNETKPVETNDRRIVFYDHFSLENRGFSQQYLELFIDEGFEILYIMIDESKYVDSNSIIKTLKESKNTSILLLKCNETRSERFNSALQKILDFAPSKIFIHNAPWDIISCCLCSALKGSGIKSYLLNITDHAYWPGADIFDYIIDFRSYGHFLNHSIKEIPKERLFIIPTPAYKVKEERFEGFENVKLNGKIIGFSGGSVYKIVDSNNTFLNLIKKVIDQNPDFIFLFANVGSSEFIEKFIERNNLKDRFILIGNRRDINEVFKNIDIYFNTYPYGGGLMIQYAISNRKPILALRHPDLPYTHIDKVIDKELSNFYEIDNEKGYLNTAGKLIRDKEFRNKYIDEMPQSEDIELAFRNELKALIYNLKSSVSLPTKDFDLSPEAVTRFHIEYDNLYFKQYIYFKKMNLKEISLKYKLFHVIIPDFTDKVIRKFNALRTR